MPLASGGQRPTRYIDGWRYASTADGGGTTGHRNILDRKYYQQPEWAEPWRIVRQDSLDAVLGKTEGIHASPYRYPANLMAQEPGRHRGEIGHPGDSSNYLDEPWEMAAVMDYKTRTGWYSDENRMKRMMDKMQAAAPPTPAPPPPPPPDLSPKELDVSSAEAPVPGPPPNPLQITQAPPDWSAGQKYAVQGVESGKALQPRRPRGGWGTTGAFNRAGMRIQNLNV